MFNDINELEREIQKFQDNIIDSNKLIQTLQDVIEAIKVQSDDFEQFNSKLENELSAHLTELRKQSVDTATRLKFTESGLNRAYAELEKKYADFLNCLEATNVYRIFQTCEQMKKSIETKLLFTSIGVGVAIILVVISFFIK